MQERVCLSGLDVGRRELVARRRWKGRARRKRAREMGGVGGCRPLPIQKIVTPVRDGPWIIRGPAGRTIDSARKCFCSLCGGRHSS